MYRCSEGVVRRRYLQLKARQREAKSFGQISIMVKYAAIRRISTPPDKNIFSPRRGRIFWRWTPTSPLLNKLADLVDNILRGRINLLDQSFQMFAVLRL